jgi:hypothetical protein
MAVFTPKLKNLQQPKELRRHRRYAVDGSILQVSWLDMKGKMRITRTRAVNICEEGMAIQLPEAAMPLLVRFKSERFNVSGVGEVRHCQRVGGQYIVGLQFSGDLRWRPPSGEIREPIPVCDPEALY